MKKYFTLSFIVILMSATSCSRIRQIGEKPLEPGPNPVLPSWQKWVYNDSVIKPNIIFDDQRVIPGSIAAVSPGFIPPKPSSLWLYYSGNNNTNWRIGAARYVQSTKSWTKVNGVILNKGSDPADIDYLGVKDPSVVYHPQSRKYFMFYTAIGSSGERMISVATSDNGINWTKNNNRAPLVRANPALNQFNSAAVTNPSVVLIGATFFMFYLAENEIGNPIRTIGLAKSTDGFIWNDYGRVINVGLDTSPGSCDNQSLGQFDDSGIEDMTAYYGSDGLKLLYVGNSNGSKKIAYAVAKNISGQFATSWCKLGTVANIQSTASALNDLEAIAMTYHATSNTALVLANDTINAGLETYQWNISGCSDETDCFNTFETKAATGAILPGGNRVLEKSSAAGISDSKNIENPSIAYNSNNTDQPFYMLYDGNDGSGTCGQNRIMKAVSPDGSSWSRSVLLAPSQLNHPSGGTVDCISEPTIYYSATDNFVLYFRYTKASEKGIAYVTSADGIAFSSNINGIVFSTNAADDFYDISLTKKGNIYLLFYQEKTILGTKFKLLSSATYSFSTYASTTITTNSITNQSITYSSLRYVSNVAIPNYFTGNAFILIFSNGNALYWSWSLDSQTWTKAEIILTPTQQFETEGLGSLDFLFNPTGNSYFQLWYAGHGGEYKEIGLADFK